MTAFEFFLNPHTKATEMVPWCALVHAWAHVIALRLPHSTHDFAIADFLFGYALAQRTDAAALPSDVCVVLYLIANYAEPDDFVMAQRSIEAGLTQGSKALFDRSASLR